MGIMRAAYGILFIIDGLYSMYITERKDVPSRPCDLIPANSSLPCRQYMISDQNYCAETKLRKLFPDLYNRVEEDWPNWPAKIENIELKESSIAWAVSPDGNINYLKGFQVIQEGNSYETIGYKLCHVIDLSELRKADLILLMQVKFNIQNNDSGSFETEIKPLPIRPENVQSGEATVSLEQSKIFDVYHPQINVSMDYLQINTTAVNISVTIDGEIEELSTFDIIITKDGQYLQNVTKTFDISQGYFLINGIKEGAYKVKITPLDPYTTSDAFDSTCVCYFGTDENRQCYSCIGYTKTIQVQQLKETITEDGSMVALILAPILVMSVLFIIALSIMYMWYRDKLPPFINILATCRRRNSPDFTSIDDNQHAKQPTIRFIYTHDHASHKSAVNSLTCLIQNSTKFLVMSDNNDDLAASDVSLISSENSVDSADAGILNCADLICVVHSEWAHKLVSVIGTGDVSVVDLTNKEDKDFLACMNEICQTPAITSKIVSVRFEYTPDSTLIREPFLGPQFNLPENTEAFIKHLNTKIDSSDIGTVNVTDKMTLFSSINASFVYQSKHKSWLFSKLFYLRNSPSSDDSGIVIPRVRNLRPRSIRSRSAETITYPTCTCDASSRRTICSMCHQKQASRLRTYSCDLSFYAPESILDETSERLSLLESKFFDINSRYHQMLNGRGTVEEDCFTFDGQSV